MPKGRKKLKDVINKSKNSDITKKSKLNTKKIDNNDDDYKPFWNDKVDTLSKKMFLPIDCLITKNTNTQSNLITEYDSNQDKNYKLKFKNNDNTTIQITKSNNIKLFLNKEQQKYMKIIIGTYRYFYNRTIDVYNNFNKDTKTSWFYIDPNNKETIVKIDFNGTNKKGIKDNYRNFMCMRDKISKQLPDWILNNFPTHVTAQAINECVINYNRGINSKKPFNIKYKTKKDILQTAKIESMCIKKNGMFVSLIINNKNLFSKISSSRPFNKKPCDSTLTYHSVLNEFHLNMPYKLNSTPTKIKNVCAIDPGVRSPLTVYSYNKVATIGENLNGTMYKICKEIDIINSRIDSDTYTTFRNNKYVTYNVTPKRKKRLRKALHRKIKKLKNIKDEFHKKSINYLVNNFSVIILPPYEIQGMVSKLHSKIARQMYNLSLYKLRLMLRDKCKELHIKLIEKSEAYTSKTCTMCGNIDALLGSKKTYACDKCEISIDRDLNGARNILLRNISFI